MRKKQFRLKPVCASLLLAFTAQTTQANPMGAAVVAGQASFATSGNTLTVTNTPGAIINWQGFSIGANEITRFAQQSTSSAVLNRVIANNPSNILGSLQSNGRVFLVNPNGIVFGQGATINVAGLVATSLNMSNADFLAGRYNFTDVPGAQNISNAGNLTAQSGGQIYLIAPNVENTGIINAPNGEILLAAGHSVELVDTTNPNLRINITAPAGDATNVGQLVAESGSLGLFGTVVRNSGKVSADSATLQGGKIVFKASQRVEAGGTTSASSTQGAGGSISFVSDSAVAVGGSVNTDGTQGGNVTISAGSVSLAAEISTKGTTGQGGSIAIQSQTTSLNNVYAKLDASGATGGSIKEIAGHQITSSATYLATGTAGQGGNIDLTAPATKLLSAQVDASGTAGGGQIRIGGEYQGGKSLAQDELSNAQTLAISAGSNIRADATIQGNGGTVILWSDIESALYADVSAQGKNGAGGFIELSSAEKLLWGGSANAGVGGQVLMDPKNIVIQDATAGSVQYNLTLGYNYTNLSGMTGKSLEVSDNFGRSVSLSGTQLAVGAHYDDGSGNATLNSGAVYLFSNPYTAPVLSGVIGKGYTGAGNYDLTSLEASDLFGISVSLSGTQLAVGANSDDGFGNAVTDSGAVYLFNTPFGTPTLSGIIGNGYTGAGNYDVTGLAASDSLGTSVSLSGTQLAVGAWGDDGSGNAATDSGAVYLFSDPYTTPVLSGIIGKGYTGAGNFDVANLGAGDWFGQSVSLSGTQLAVGADSDDGVGNTVTDSGAVYLFNNPFGTTTLSGIIGKGYTGAGNYDLIGLEASDFFGKSISLSGTQLAVGAPRDDGSGNVATDSGAVYLFNNPFGTTTLSGIIGKGYTGAGNYDVTGLEVTDLFGYSVALSGTQLAVGAVYDGGFGNVALNSGAVYLFNNLDTTPTLSGIIGKGYTGAGNFDPGEVLEPGDSFGYSVSLSGTQLAAGAVADDGSSNAVTDSGAVYLFNNPYTAPVLSGIIGKGYTGAGNYDVANLEGGDLFGYSVSLSGTQLAVGAYHDDGSGNFALDSGAVYLFNNPFGATTLSGILGSGYSGMGSYGVTSLEATDMFGASVSLYGTQLAVGASWDSGLGNTALDSGAVYLFNNPFSTLTLSGIIGKGYTGAGNYDVTSLETGDLFGTSISLSGTQLAVGAVYDDGSGNATTNSGAVYLFNNPFSTPTLSGIVGKGYTGAGNYDVTSLEAVGDLFGVSVALSGAQLAVGASGDDGFGNAVTNSGAVYLFNDPFSTPALSGIIGKGYTGAGNYDVTGLEAGDSFGNSISLFGTQLAVGASDDGAGNAVTDSGAVYLFTLTHALGTAPASGQTFAATSALDSSISPASITAILNTGSALTLQANNDITISSAIIANNVAGDGGALTLQAGRSVLANANITTDNGNLTLITNDTLANGVVDAYRDAGAAAITMASGVSLNTGTGSVILELRDGAGLTNNTVGVMTVGDLTAGTVNLSSTGGSIVQNAATVISTPGLLTTSSAGGTTLNGANTIGSFTASNITSGNIAFANNGAFTVLGVTNSAAGGSITLTDTLVNTAITNPTAAISTNNGAITLTADKMNLAVSTGTINAGTGTVTLQNNTLSNAINIGSVVDTTATTLELSQAELNTITASGGLTIGSASNTGAVTVSAPTTLTNNTTLLNSTGGIAINGAITGGAHNLTLTTTKAITQTAPISTTGTLTANSGFGLTLNAANTVGTFAASNSSTGNNNNIEFTNNGAFTVGTVSNPAWMGNVILTNTAPQTLLTHSAGTISASSLVTLISDKMSMVGTISGAVILKNTTPSNAINIGSTVDTTPNTLELSNAEMANITGASLTIGSSSNTGSITVSSATTLASISTKLLNSTGGIAINGAITGGAANLSLDTTGAITQAGAISFTGILTTSAAGGITLNAANAVTGFKASNSGGASAISLANTAATLDISGIDQTGTGAVTINTSGSVKVTGPITVPSSLALFYGQGAVAAGNTGTLTTFAPVNLPAGLTYSTTLGSNGVATNYTVITVLGAESSVTALDLQGISGNLAGNYVLGANVDASASSAWNAGAGFAPIGNNTTPFTGTFNGLGHTVSNLTINRPATDYVGLFGATGTGSAINNVGLTGAVVAGRWFVGGLVGDALAGTISNSYSSGAITGVNWVGGLIGTANATLSNVYSTGTVSGQSSVGGLVGAGTWSTISNSYSSSAVTGTGAGSKVGGFVGDATWSTISNSYSLGAVAGTSSVGGFTGAIDAASNGTITTSYSSGAVTGTTNVGGLIGLLGSGSVTNSYWDIATSGQATSAGGTGLATTADAMTQTNYAGLDFTNTWWMSDTNTHPMLRSEWNYTITNAHQLQLMGMNATTLAAKYTLSSDVSMAELSNASGIWNTATGFIPVGDNAGVFGGTFDGQNHVISNLIINRPTATYVALFGRAGDGDIRNIGLTNVSITGGLNGGYSAALVGQSWSAVTNAYSTGTVSGNGLSGGLIAYNYGPRAIVTNSYSSANVTDTHATGYAAGLVGVHSDGAAIVNSHATGTVNGASYTGGFVGSMSSNSGTLAPTVTGSYSTGAVTAANAYGGGFVGFLNGYAIVSNSYATGNVSGISNIGGFAGRMDAQLDNVYATGNVTGTGSVGGLVGLSYATAFAHSITNSHSTGTVTGTGGAQGIGGLVGTSAAVISNSYSTSTVVGLLQVGGLVGVSHGNAATVISNSYSAGNVTGSNGTGGLVGENAFSQILNSYSTSVVQGTTQVGGLVGVASHSSGSISNSYSTGSVTGTTSVGGLVGNNLATVTGSYWDTVTSGKASGIGAGTLTGTTGLTTAQMHQAASFTGFSISNAGGSAATWRIYEESTTPLLRSFLTPITLTPVYDGTVQTLANVADYTANIANPITANIIQNSLTLTSSATAGTHTALLNVSSVQQGYDITTSAVTITGTGSTANNIKIANALTATNGNLILNATGNVSLTSNLTLTNGSVDVQTGGVPGTGTLNVSAGTSSVGALKAGTLGITAGSIALNGASTLGNLSLSGGTLTGSGNIDVSGAFSWTGNSAIAGSGTLTTLVGGTTALAPNFNQTTYLVGSRIWNNYGTVTFTPNVTGLSYFRIDDTTADGTAVFNNMSGGVFNLTPPGSTNHTIGVGTFNNAGIFNKNVNVSSSFAPVFNNQATGVVNVTSGTLTFGGTGTDVAGSTYNVPLGSTLNFGASRTVAGSIAGAGSVGLYNSGGVVGIGISGSYNVSGATSVWADCCGSTTISFTGPVTNIGTTFTGSANSTVDFSGITSGEGTAFANLTSISSSSTLTFKAGTVLSGLTALTVSGGTLDLVNSSLTLATLDITGGTLTGSGSVSVTGAFNWGGANTAISGSGTLTTQVGSTTALTPGWVKTNLLGGSRVWDNYGTVNFTPDVNYSYFQIDDTLTGGTAVFNNMSGGVFNINASTTDNHINGVGTFNNAGILNKNLNGTAASSGINPAFNNQSTGVVNVTSGTLALNGIGTDVAGSAYNVASGATLQFGASRTVPGSIAGVGTMSFAGGVTTVSGSYNVSGSTQISGTTTANFTGPVTNVGSSLVASSGTTLNFGGISSGEGTAFANLTSINSASTLTFKTGTVLSGLTALTVGGGTLDLANSSLSLITLDVVSGTLTGSGNIDVSSAFNWGGSINSFITGSGTLTTQVGSATALTPGFARTVSLRDSRIWNNYGTVTFTPDSGTLSTFQIDDTLTGGTAVFNNMSGGVFNINASYSDNHTTGVGTFNNAGILNKNLNGTAASSGINPAFNNQSTGVVNVTSGTLALNGIGTDVAGSAYNVASGATLQFSASRNIAGSVAGAGTLNVTAGTINLDNAAATNLTALNLSGGTLGGASSVVLSAGSSFNWTGGTVAGHLTTQGTTSIPSGTITLGAGALWDNSSAVTIASGGWGYIGANAILNNSGSIDIGGNFGINFNGVSGAQFNNLATGTVTLSGAYSAPITGAGGTFSNAGTLTKTTATAQTITNLSNTGIVNVNSSTLSVAGALTQSGTINVATGATFTKTAGFTNTGTLAGVGAIDVGAATLTNTGAIAPGVTLGDTTGTLSITGNLLMGAGGNLNLDINSSLVGDYDVLNVSGTADLTSGTLNISGSGDAASYTVLNATGGLGGTTFATINAGTFTQTPTYAATSLTLTVTANSIAGFILWDGGAGTFNWADALNWSADTLPTATDNIYIASLGANSLLIDSGARLGNKLVCDADFQLAGGGLTLGGTASFNGVSNISGGTLNIAGAFQMGTLSWTSGTITGAGVMNVSSLNMPAGTTLNGVNAMSLDGKTMNVNGNTGFSSGVANGNNGADLTLLNGAIINNNAIWSLDNIANIIVGTGGGTFNNFGEIRVGQNGAATATIGTVFNHDNSFPFDLIHGARIFNGNLIVAGSGTSIFDAFDAQAGTTIEFSNGYNFNVGDNFGLGDVILSGGQVNSASILRSENITIAGAVASSGNLSLAANNNILLAAGSSISSSSGALNINLNSDFNGAAGGGIYLDTGSSINSNGGNISMGGMPSMGYAIGNGTVTGGKTFNSGIYVLGDITAGAGNVTMRGEGRAFGSGSNHLADGITFAGGLLSSNGTVSIDGLAHVLSETTAGTEVTAGVDFLGVGTRLSTQTGTVTVTGLNDAGAGFCRAQGITVEAGTIIETTGTGTLTLNGTSTGYDTGWGVGIFGGTVRTTATGGGAITLYGTNVTNPDGGVVILDGNVLSSGGEIRIIGEGLGGSGTIGTSTIGGVSSGDILIKANNSGPINITSTSSINAGSNTLTLVLAGGSFNDNGSSMITAGALRLLGSGTFNLGGANNNVATLAANVTGNVTYNDTNGFAIGSVTSFDGAAATTTTGVASYGNFTGTTVGSITLNAGSAISTGPGALLNLTATGGNLNIAGSVSADIFTLGGGTWNQVAATLPSLTVNDFRIAGGTFIRALGGDGTVGVPYQLADIYGVQGMGSSGMLGNSYVLANNIDASGTVNWNAGAGFAPVGNATTNFTGTFDGLSHTISNFTINRPTTNNVGLFGYAGAGSIIRNVGVLGGSVSGLRLVGGLVGNNFGGISNSYTTGTVNGTSQVGGLVGYNTGTVSNSYATGSVSGTIDLVGGLVGTNTGTVSNSYATGSVSGTIDFVGGLVSTNTGTVSNSYATGTVNGTSQVGGLISYNIGTVSNSYATGSVSGTVDFVGGLVGFNDGGTINNSYAMGNVSGANFVGGLIGELWAGTVTNSFWSTTTSGQATSAAGTGLTTAQMQTMSSFTGWNISSTGSSGAVWRIYEGQTAPLLTSFLMPLTLADTPVTYNGATQSGVTTAIAGVLGAAASGSNAGFYSGYYSTQQGYDITGGSLTISAAPLTLSTSDISKTYDGGLTAAGIATVTGGTLFGSDSISGGTFAFTDKNVGSGNKTVTASGITVNDGNSGANYTVAYADNTTSTITQAALSISGITAANKVYDATTAATVSTAGATYTGLIGGDLVTVNASGAFADKNAGTAKTVTLTSSYTGADTGNYTITGQTSTTADITPATLTVSATGANKVYDGLTAAGITLADNRIAGDLLTLGNSAAGFLDKNVGAAKTVNVGGITVTGADAGNYTFNTTATASADITPASLAVSGITAANKVYDATTAATVSTAGATYTGLIGGDLVTVNASGAFADKNAGTAKTVTLTSSYTGADTGNYTITGQTSALADITPALLTIDAVTDSKVYDGTTGSAGAVNIGALFGGDTVTGATQAFASKNVMGANGSTLAVTGYSINDGNNGANYTVTSNAVNGTITPAALTIGGIVASNKTYDATTAATIDTANTTYAGLIAGDTVTVNASGAFADKNAGTAKTVTLTSNYTGADVNNYSIVDQAATVADITARALTVTATGANKVYDGLTAAGITLADNRIAGDLLTLGNSAAGFLDKNVGTAKTVNISGITVTGTDAGNYTFNTTATASADITPASLTVSGITAANKIYDATTAATVDTANTIYAGLIGGDLVTVNASGAFADKNAATGKTVTLTSSYTGADTGNYTITGQTSTTADITPATLTVSATGANKVYDGLTAAGITLADNRIAGDLLTLGNSAAGFLDKNVGAAKTVNVGGITVTGADALNYILASNTASTTADITPASLTVSGIAAANKVYDATTAATVNTTGATYTGLIGGDLVTVNASGAFADKNAGTAKTVTLTSNYTGADVNNYSIADQTNTAADITARTLNIAATAANKIYDGTTNAAATLADDRIAGDVLTLTGAAGFLDKNVGTAKTVNISGITVTGTDAGNYTFNTTATASADITPALLTVSGIAAANKVYDATTAATVNTTGATYTGLIGGDLVTVNASGAFADKNAATGKTVTLTSSYTGADTGNYTITGQTSTTADITPAILTVAASTATKTYDGLAYSGGNGVNYTGFVNGETNAVLTGTLAYGGTSQGAINAGSYVLTPGGLTSSNYTISYTNGALTVNTAPLTVAANAQTKIYGNADPALTYTATGLIGTDVLTGVLTRVAGENVVGGPYTISQGALTNSNYTISYTGNNLTITPATLTIAANAQSKLEGSVDPLLTYMVSGLKLTDTEAATLSGTLARQAGETVGAYPINQGTLTSLSANYTMNYVNSGLTIAVNQAAVAAAPAAVALVMDTLVSNIVAVPIIDIPSTPLTPPVLTQASVANPPPTPAPVANAPADTASVANAPADTASAEPGSTDSNDEKEAKESVIVADATAPATAPIAAAPLPVCK